MTSQDFISIANNDECINAYQKKFPEKVQEDIERISNKKIVKLLLYKAGEKIIDILITILQNIIIKKYGNI